MPIPALVTRAREIIAERIFRGGEQDTQAQALRPRVHAVAAGILPADDSEQELTRSAKVLLFVDPGAAQCELSAIHDFVFNVLTQVIGADTTAGSPADYFQLVHASRFKVSSGAAGVSPPYFRAGEAVTYFAPFRFNLPPVTLGTLGARMTAGGDDYILSCNHVLAHNGRAPRGTPVITPGPMEDATYGPVIGELAQWVPLAAPPWPLRGTPDNLADCAVALVDPGYDAAFEGAFNICAPPLYDPLPDCTPVAKVGHATGTTYGWASMVDFDVYIDFTFGPYFFGAPTGATAGTGMIGVIGRRECIDGVFVRPPFAAPGDSGALVWSERDDQPGIGLVMARSYTFDEITNRFTGYIALVSPLTAIQAGLADAMHRPASDLAFYRAPSPC